jgi:hypothetical protein
MVEFRQQKQAQRGRRTDRSEVARQDRLKVAKGGVGMNITRAIVLGAIGGFVTGATIAGLMLAPAVAIASFSFGMFIGVAWMVAARRIAILIKIDSQPAREIFQ